MDGKFCSHCDKEITAEAELCPHCGVRVSRAQGYKDHKSAGLAAVLSFFIPGLGQIYNGQIDKGIVMVVALVVFWFLTAILIGIPLLLVLWVYGIYDAYNVANEINKGTV